MKSFMVQSLGISIFPLRILVNNTNKVLPLACSGSQAVILFPKQSVKDFVERASLVKEKHDLQKLEYELQKSQDEDYLKDNPNRRFPDLSKARKLLNYIPEVNLEEGLSRWYKHEK